MRQDEIVAQARTYVGTPWKHQGRSRAGVDCGGLIWCVWHDLGDELEDAPPGYKKQARSYNFVALFEKAFQRVNMQELRDGDVLIFKMPDQAYPMHAGIVARRDGALTLIEARSDRTRRVVETRLTDDYLARVTHVFRDRSVA